jgi:hypothetical protein
LEFWKLYNNIIDLVVWLIHFISQKDGIYL